MHAWRAPTVSRAAPAHARSMTSRTDALGPEPDVAVTPKPGKANATEPPAEWFWANLSQQRRSFQHGVDTTGRHTDPRIRVHVRCLRPHGHGFLHAVRARNVVGELFLNRHP